jgi:hypothetical protein
MGARPRIRRFFYPLAGNAEVEKKMKKKCYCVMSEFYDDGRVKAAMISSECAERPKNTCRELPRLDAYKDWFDTREEAEGFLAEARAEGKGPEAAA